MLQLHRLLIGTSIVLLCMSALLPTRTHAGSSTTPGVAPDSSSSSGGTFADPGDAGGIGGLSLSQIGQVINALSDGGADGVTISISLGGSPTSVSSQAVGAALSVMTGQNIGGFSGGQAAVAVRGAFIEVGVPEEDIEALLQAMAGVMNLGEGLSAKAPANQLVAMQTIALQPIALRPKLKTDLNKEAQPTAQRMAASDSPTVRSVDPVKLQESIDAFNNIILSSDRETLEAIKLNPELMFIRSTLNGLADAVINRRIAVRSTPPAPETTPAIQATTPATTGDTLAVADSGAAYAQALEAANTAAQLAQTADTFGNWSQVAASWQTAIALMQMVPASSPNYATAQASINSYQQSLDYAQKQADPFYQAVKAASSAAELVQVAQSRRDWEVVADQWRRALELMRVVPQSYPRYNIARDRVNVYQRNLNYALEQAAKAS